MRMKSECCALFSPFPSATHSHRHSAEVTADRAGSALPVFLPLPRNRAKPSSPLTNNPSPISLPIFRVNSRSFAVQKIFLFHLHPPPRFLGVLGALPSAMLISAAPCFSKIAKARPALALQSLSHAAGDKWAHPAGHALPSSSRLASPCSLLPHLTPRATSGRTGAGSALPGSIDHCSLGTSSLPSFRFALHSLCCYYFPNERRNGHISQNP
jgi:hypothetical protein